MWALERRLEAPRPVAIPGCHCVAGQICDRAVTLCCTGDGAAAAARGAQALLEQQEAAGILILGVAGALSRGLAPGDVVICREVRDEQGGVFEASAELVARAARYPESKVGSTLSTARIVVSAEDKGRLWEEHGSGPNQVVDLESAVLCDLARRQSLSALVVRAVSDGADETLPLDFNRFRTAEGGVDRAAVLRQAIRRPGLMPKLMKLRHRVRSAALDLDGVVAEVLAR